MEQAITWLGTSILIGTGIISATYTINRILEVYRETRIVENTREATVNVLGSATTLLSAYITSRFSPSKTSNSTQPEKSERREPSLLGETDGTSESSGNEDDQKE